MIVTLIMAIISVFTKDMKNIDEMYNINMIKVAAERLLQIKEKDFLMMKIIKYLFMAALLLLQWNVRPRHVRPCTAKNLYIF